MHVRRITDNIQKSGWPCTFSMKGGLPENVILNFWRGDRHMIDLAVVSSYGRGGKLI